MSMLIICVLLVLYISIITALIVFGCVTLSKELKLNRTIKEKEILMKVDINTEMMNIIDKFIEDSILQYRLKYLTESDNLYITTQKQQEMTRSVLKDVLENISPSLYEKMILVYNKNKLEDIIYLKISMAIIAFVSTINGSYKE